ncbi:MAG: tRNA (adenosine(37)-N6)-dimethylallyltransferase MiaA [bacterium]|nr:tRNA (adenosine(37)-N6)-dimethylallyltransferase MiaA [bacterium]
MTGKRPQSKTLRPRKLPRIVCVVGPTSSGKTSLSIRLAKHFNGEVVNADARQCYRDFTIGTGTPKGERKVFHGRKAYMVDDVPHYLIDFLDPTHVLTAPEWRDMALRAVRGITKRNHLPLIVGGTGLYVKALVDNYAFPNVSPNSEFRKAFQNKPLSELVALLKKLDPVASEIVDLKNPRRVIRALEVVTFTGKTFSERRRVGKPVVEAFQVGMMLSREELFSRIDTEVEEMVERGWIDEIREIQRKNIPLDAPAMTSIGYRELLAYIQGERTLEKAIATCKTAVHHYAKRQETWYKRDPRIHWAHTEDEAFGMVEGWLNDSNALEKKEI